MKHHILSALIALLVFPAFSAQIPDTATVHFRQGDGTLDPSFRDNRTSLDSIIAKIRKAEKDPMLRLRRVNVFGGASPEGPVALNRRLSEQRAQGIYSYISERGELPAGLVTFRYLGRDWKGLQQMVEHDMFVPERQEVLQLLDAIVATATPSTEGDAEAIRSLQQIGGGASYRYLYNKLYPSLRESGIALDYAFTPRISDGTPDIQPLLPEPLLMETELMEFGETRICRPFHMDMRTNLLYDALALPNIGADFYLAKNISIGANWMYGWWDRNSAHRYWRAYGGDLNLRWWFGRQAHEKPLTGHHLGVYGGVVTYDFEFGGTGYMGGLPHETLWSRCNRFAGVEYGYSLPVARRLNIDFTLGIGYLGGKYIKYIPKGNGYLWQSTHQLRWFGPTKAEISLVWLIGCDNYNRKGGAR